MSTTEPAKKAKGQWGGARPGSGPKPLTDAKRLERRLEAAGIEPTDAADPVAAFAKLIGLSPRVAALRPDLVDQCELVSPGEHLARFARHFCRYNQLGETDPGGPVLGDPVEFEDFETEFDDEALECDERGRRVWKRVGVIIGRKNRKTTRAGIKSLYFGSPADGEHRPVVVQAAGVKHQAGKLYSSTKAFIDDPKYGSRELAQWFVPMMNRILCPSIGGEIFRVAGDGDNNMSLDPHAVVLDELHTWKEPRQRENLVALSTAGGGRLDPFIEFITTEGDGDDNALAELMDSLEDSPETEVEHRRAGLTIYRNRAGGLLVYRYAAPADVNGRKTTIADVDLIKLANPAPWRTRERLLVDLADPMVPEASKKLRLYGNIRGSSVDRWLSDEAIALMTRLDLEIPKPPRGLKTGRADIVVAVDAAITRDTTVCSYSWLHPNGYIVQRTRVWSCNLDRPHDVLVPGGRLDNDLVRDFILEELVPHFNVQLVFYDKQYFETQAKDLSDADLVVVEMDQKQPEMKAAWNEYYHDIHEGDEPRIAIGGEEGPLKTLVRHMKNAVGHFTDGGWRVSKKGGKNSILVIDAVAGNVMSAYGIRHLADFMPKRGARGVSW